MECNLSKYKSNMECWRVPRKYTYIFVRYRWANSCPQEDNPSRHALYPIRSHPIQYPMPYSRSDPSCLLSSAIKTACRILPLRHLSQGYAHFIAAAFMTLIMPFETKLRLIKRALHFYWLWLVFFQDFMVLLASGDSWQLKMKCSSLIDTLKDHLGK